MIKRSLFPLVVVCLALPALSRAWDDTGHMTVAKIAYDHLTPAARARVDRLLQENPGPDFTDFVRSGTYPDQLKRYGIKAYSPWHAISIPYSKDGTKPGPTRPDNVVWAIGQCTDALKDDKTIPFEKARMLRFLIHFVGDAHQPLHAATLYDSAHPDGDDNGHGYLLGKGKKDHLHGIWDTAFGTYHDLPDSRAVDLGEVTNLARLAEDRDHGAEVGNAEDLDPADWAKESHQIAVDFAYSTPEGAPPSAEYTVKAKAICNKRIVLAGYRLANLLNGIFGDK